MEFSSAGRAHDAALTAEVWSPYVWHSRSGYKHFRTPQPLPSLATCRSIGRRTRRRFDAQLWGDVNLPEGSAEQGVTEGVASPLEQHCGFC